MNELEQIKELKRQIDELKSKIKNKDKPEFKEGDWIVGEDNMGKKNIIAKIISISEPNKHGNYWIESTHNKCGLYFIGETLRNATKEEIEQALIKEAKRRGFKQGVKAKSMYNKEDDFLYKMSERAYPSYNYKSDMFWFGGFCIYNNGEWSEIIEQKLTIAGHQVEESNYAIKIGCTSFPKDTLVRFFEVRDRAKQEAIDLYSEEVDKLKELL